MTTEEPILAAEIPHQTQIPAWQKWRSFGTGLGIEVGVENLLATLTVVRPGGIRVVDALTIERYRERPAAEWGAEFQAFLAKNKASHVSATVVLPSQDVISRILPLPGVPPAELPAAVEYQLDGLHPFAEEEASHSFARLAPPHETYVALGIGRHTVINDYATLFDEAGIDVAAFVTPAAAIYSALRTLQSPPAPAFLAVHEDTTGLLVYGETSTHPVYCVRFGAGSDRAVASASSQIRLAADAPVARLASLLPVADRSELCSTLSYAASLSGALPRQALGVNLLPVDRRKTSSPWRWVPTMVLVVLLMLVGIAFASYQEFENRRLLTKLDAELARLQPRVARVRTLDSGIENNRKQIEALVELASWPRKDLDALRELTRLMPMSSYVATMEISQTNLTMSGEIEQAMELLKIIDASPLFSDSEFMSSPGRTNSGKEVFQLRARREFAPAAQGTKP